MCVNYKPVDDGYRSTYVMLTHESHVFEKGFFTAFINFPHHEYFHSESAFIILQILNPHLN